KLHWLHVNSTAFLTHLQWHPRRGQVAMDEIGILPLYQGRLMRDRLSSYDHYECEQSICGAHLLRDLTAIWQQFKQQWASDMKDLLLQMNELAHQYREQGVLCLPAPLRNDLVACYFEILLSGYAAQPPPVPKPAG